jgi:putative flippase GtrA
MSIITVQFMQFAGVGVLGTLAHYTLLVLMVEVFHSEVIIATSCGALLGALVNYALNYKFTFKSNKRHVEALSKFLVIAAVGFVLNAILMALFANILAWYYLAAQVATTLLVLVWNFLGNRCWTFAH